ncbi:MAG: hypothetical protein ACYC90_07410 [Candidatus Nanopelagicales bacterium]
MPSTRNVIGSVVCRAPAPFSALAAFFAADPGTRGLDTRVPNAAKRTDVPPSPAIHSRMPGSSGPSGLPDCRWASGRVDARDMPNAWVGPPSPDAMAWARASVLPNMDS